MSLSIISRKFYDDQNREVNFLLGNANNYIKCVYRINVDYTINLSPSTSLLVNGTTLTLTNGAWEDFGFVVGSNLLSVNVNGHIATKDILIISGADMLINSTFHPSIPDGNYTTGTLTCLTKTEGLNVHFNFCKNSFATPNSLIDGEINRWTVDELDLLSVGATKNLTRLGNQSGLGKIISQTVKKVRSSPLVFEVTIETFITPFWTGEPFFSAESLASWVKFQALPDFNNPNVLLERSEKYNGNVGYFNENFNGNVSAYVKDSISWEDANGNSLDVMDFAQPSLFETRINGTFTSGSKFQFYAFFPSTETEDFSSLPTDASKNFISTTHTKVMAVNTDYTFATENNSVGAGVQFVNVRIEQFGTYAIVTGRVEPNAEFTDLMQNRDSNNRRYRLWVRCENPSLDFNSSDMVNVEIDNGLMLKATQPLGTFDMDEQFLNHVLEPLELDKDTYTIITEDDVLRVSSFQLPRHEEEYTEINVRTRAINITTGESFDLEKFTCNLSALPMLPNGTRPINSIIQRPFNIAFPSQMTRIIFERVTADDTVDSYAVRVKYPFLSRWEYWLQQLNASNDFFGNKTRNWRTYQNTDWKVESVLGIVKGDGEYQNPYTIAIRDYDDADIPYTFEFFRLDGTPITAPLDEIVRVKVTHDATVSDCWGTITVEPKENAPRWLISTDYAQTDPNYPLQPLNGETALKKRINADSVEFECLFDGRLFNEVKFTSRLENDVSHRVLLETKIAKKPKSLTPENRGLADCGCIPFLTIYDPNSTERHRNDVNSAWEIGEQVTFTLKKEGQVTNYTPTAIPFPNQPDAFYTTIEWRDVAFLDGVGCFTLEVTSTFAGISQTRIWGKYQLVPYSQDTVGKTVRLLSYFNDVNSSIGIEFTNAFVKDTLRLKGMFGFWDDLTEIDNIQYTDAERMKVKREDVTEYELRIDLHSECYIERLRFHLLSENACYITDHNSRNYTYSYLDFPVIVKEGFKPNWIEGTRQVKGVAKFQDKQKLKRTHYQDNEGVGNFQAPQNAFVPAQITDGEEVIQVGSGQSYTCVGGLINVSNSNGTYDVDTSTDLVLPDTNVNVYVDGVLSGTGTIVTLDSSEVINILWT